MSRIKLIIFFFVFLPVLSSAQMLSFDINGKVIDEDSKPLSMVSVAIEEMNISTFTDSKGVFNFSGIPPGDYHVTFSRTGYVTRTMNIEIRNTHNLGDIKLEKTLIETSTIDVTSSFNPVDISNSSYSISTITARNLTKQRDQILGSTIANLPGVNSISTGIGIGKPVIRGLSSLSVLIVHDGIKHESQQWGDEHSPEISLYDLDRIEILRGPASLLYGSEGIGGVVNIISKPLQFANNKKTLLYGDLDLGGFSVNNQTTGNIMLGLGLKNTGFKGHFGYRNSGNVKTPDGKLLVSTLIPGIMDTISGGELSNSGSKEYEGGLSFGWSGKSGYISAGYETFNREIQMHDADPFSTGNQKLNTNQFELIGNLNLSGKFQLEPILSFQNHSRKEFQSIEDKNINKAYLNWQLKILQGELRLHYNPLKNLSGTYGLSTAFSKNESLGENKLIPNFESTNLGLYGTQSYNSKYFSISAGARIDTKLLDVEKTVFSFDSSGNPLKVINDRDLSFTALSGSLGFVYKPDETVSIYSNFGRGWRAPSEFELFVDGEHEGTNRVERGILTLNPGAEPTPEGSLNIDLGLRMNYKKINADISLYNNTVYNFLYPSPAGEIDSASSLPVFNIRQDKSTFRGIEYSIQYQPVEFILLNFSGDYILTKNTASGNPLPFTPPAKNIMELKMQKSNIGFLYNPYFSFSAKVVSPAKDVDPLETTTDGYVLLNAGLGFDFVLSKSIASIDFKAENLADLKYVDHLSRFKNIAMNPGRNISLKISVPFSF